ncbi:MAG: flavin reductase, partial [Comamonas sp.]|nr:flavin reductase [Comamonas sp.]
MHALPSHFTAVALDKSYRLLNHGPTVIVSARHGDERNAMSAAWACALDFAPPKVTVVLDKATRTRALVEASGLFALQLPTVPMAALTKAIGTDSATT